jgi:Zn-dependent peptidase ImmA (M78 family)
MVSERHLRSFLIEDFLKREGSDDPEDAILKLAQRLVKSAGMKPPIDVFALAKFYGIRVREVRDPNIDGQVIPLKNGFVIEVSKEKPIRRKRFTVAHELIHVFLMKSIGTSSNSILAADVPIVSSEIEFLCNLGAGEILMPGYLFEPKLAHYGISIDTLFRLSRDFQTTIASTAMRIVRGNGRCAFIFWRLMAKPGATEDFRVDWSIAPKGIFIPRYDRAISSHLHLRTVYEALTSDEGRSSGVENINWLGNLKGRYYVESVVIRNYNSIIPGVLSLIHL